VHSPEGWGVDAQNRFDTHLQLSHLSARPGGDCFNCHQWMPGAPLGVRGVAGKYGSFTQEDFDPMREVYLSAASSSFLDHNHLSHGLKCAACHTDGIFDQVDNATCLSCHGPMATLAAKKYPSSFRTEICTNRILARSTTRFVMCAMGSRKFTVSNAIPNSICILMEGGRKVSLLVEDLFVWLAGVFGH